MKQWIALLLSILILVSLTACSQTPEATDGETTVETTVATVSGLIYNIGDYEHFSQIFDEKTDAQWEAMGRYTVILQGFSTPVTVEMDRYDILSVSAYGHTCNVNIGQLYDEVNGDIEEYNGAILVNDWRDYQGSTWIFTGEACFEYLPEGDISTQIYLSNEGTLRYTRYWGEYQTTFNQCDTAPIDCCTSRDEFLYEAGRAEIADGQIRLIQEQFVTVSDLYDLDTLFAEAKAAGMYKEYASVDEVLEANKNK